MAGIIFLELRASAAPARFMGRPEDCNQVNRFLRPNIYALSSIIVFLSWFSINRWQILVFRDSLIVASIAAVAVGFFYIISVLIENLSFKPRGMTCFILIPPTAVLLWFILFALLVRITVVFAQCFGLEDSFNNAIIFIWSDDGYVNYIFLAFLFAEWLLWKMKHEIPGAR